MLTAAASQQSSGLPKMTSILAAAIHQRSRIQNNDCVQQGGADGKSATRRRANFSSKAGLELGDAKRAKLGNACLAGFGGSFLGQQYINRLSVP